MSNSNHPLVAQIRSLKADLEQAAFEVDKATTGDGNMAAAVRGRKLLMKVSNDAHSLRADVLPFTKNEEEPEPAVLPTTPPTQEVVTE